MTNWYGELSTTERRTIWACWAGWVLDAMDLMIYSLAMPTLIALWSMTNAQAGSLATAALLSSALGGWISGMLCDRIGRVRILQICIIWFAFFTALSGFTNSPDQLLIVRTLQGIGFGGEWAAGAVLMGELIQPRHRGKALGVVQSGFQWGYGLAVLLSTVLFSIMAASNAWRALFFVGMRRPCLSSTFAGLFRNRRSSKMRAQKTQQPVCNLFACVPAHDDPDILILFGSCRRGASDHDLATDLSENDPRPFDFWLRRISRCLPDRGHCRKHSERLSL